MSMSTGHAHVYAKIDRVRENIHIKLNVTRKKLIVSNKYNSEGLMVIHKCVG